MEYLVQAANNEEREEWTTAIANVIRRLDIKYKVIIKWGISKSAKQLVCLEIVITQSEM